MRLGLYLGYAPPGTNPTELVALAQEAERLGYHSAWAAEAWGTDAVTVLSWIAATTERIKVGSAIMQIPGRTPANTAMTAATLDLMSGGRFLLGLGVSGPQVVEGWHGQPWGKPLGKTREYVEIVRAALRREMVEHHGEHYDVPYSGANATGLGKPLKLMARPLRPDIPIYLAARRRSPTAGCRSFSRPIASTTSSGHSLRARETASRSRPASMSSWATTSTPAALRSSRSSPCT